VNHEQFPSPPLNKVVSWSVGVGEMGRCVGRRGRRSVVWQGANETSERERGGSSGRRPSTLHADLINNVSLTATTHACTHISARGCARCAQHNSHECSTNANKGNRYFGRCIRSGAVGTAPQRLSCRDAFSLPLRLREGQSSSREEPELHDENEDSLASDEHGEHRHGLFLARGRQRNHGSQDEECAGYHGGHERWPR